MTVYEYCDSLVDDHVSNALVPHRYKISTKRIGVTSTATAGEGLLCIRRAWLPRSPSPSTYSSLPRFS